ncbi:hypothetical protein B0A68_19620 [Flavobacterium reichenbachii]|nr:hypothetical protein B0A68_19620 [Flavobacterium reichenbachii]
MIATDGTLGSQSKSAAYYQSSYVISKRELDFKIFHLHVFQKGKSSEKTSFSVFVTYLKLKIVFGFYVKGVVQLQALLHQNINSFIKQSIFVNEIETSKNLRTSLYIA